MISKYENENLKKSTVGICNIINLFVYGMRKSVSSREIWKIKVKRKEKTFLDSHDYVQVLELERPVAIMNEPRKKSIWLEKFYYN